MLEVEQPFRMDLDPMWLVWKLTTMLAKNVENQRGSANVDRRRTFQLEPFIVVIILIIEEE